MRPVVRGDKPKNKEGKVFAPTRYQEFRAYLIERIGTYCSYCERSLSHNIAVEHIRPKDSNPHLEKEWGNLLLACVNCNSTKKDKPINLIEYCWPDKDNTGRAFVYSSAGRIQINTSLSEEQRNMALNMIELVGLDKEPSDSVDVNPEQKDRRWRERRDTWIAAERCLEKLKKITIKTLEKQ